jgi:hypothetical protein
LFISYTALSAPSSLLLLPFLFLPPIPFFHHFRHLPHYFKLLTSTRIPHFVHLLTPSFKFVLHCFIPLPLLTITLISLTTLTQFITLFTLGYLPQLPIDPIMHAIISALCLLLLQKLVSVEEE